MSMNNASRGISNLNRKQQKQTILRSQKELSRQGIGMETADHYSLKTLKKEGCDEF